MKDAQAKVERDVRTRAEAVVDRRRTLDGGGGWWVVGVVAGAPKALMWDDINTVRAKLDEPQ